jgi:sugar/nucleoside kinase (ribokinase family)
VAELVDATGAGDVFAATYVWADLGGLGLAERLALGVLAAALAVAAPSGAGGAPHRAELERHARARRLALPRG